MLRNGESLSQTASIFSPRHRLLYMFIFLAFPLLIAAKAKKPAEPVTLRLMSPDRLKKEYGPGFRAAASPMQKGSPNAVDVRLLHQRSS